MTIYADVPDTFTCAICLEEQPSGRWRDPSLRDHPPLCWTCEQEHSAGVYGDRNPDRRLARQISALANTIEVEAYRAHIGEAPLYPHPPRQYRRDDAGFSITVKLKDSYART